MRRRQSQGPEERPTYPIVAGSQPNNPASVVTIARDDMMTATPQTSMTARPTTNNRNGGNVLELPEPPSHPPPKPLPPKPGIPPGIPPTRLPPTHVYAPMPAMGALSIGFLSKKKTTKEEDFKGLIHGNTINARSSFFGFPLVNGPYDSL